MSMLIWKLVTTYLFVIGIPSLIVIFLARKADGDDITIPKWFEALRVYANYGVLSATAVCVVGTILVVLIKVWG